VVLTCRTLSWFPLRRGDAGAKPLRAEAEAVWYTLANIIVDGCRRYALTTINSLIQMETRVQWPTSSAVEVPAERIQAIKTSK
jgi:hypothetical protein